MTQRRIVSIWFPQLAMNRWRKAHTDTDEGGPLALASEAAHGTIIDAINEAAGQSGIRPGQKLTDARAICPGLQIEASDPGGDARWLAQLAIWARRWSPWTAADGEDGLLFDTTGSGHLFGGEAALVRDMHRRFTAIGLAARIAVAPTPGAAWALAHFGGRGMALCPEKDLKRQLAPLPVEALRIDADTALLLRRLGLKTIGALDDIPRLSLARRFHRVREGSADPLHRLDQALGRVAELVVPLATDPAVRAVQRVAEPVLHIAILTPVLAGLTENLCELLKKRQRGLRRVRFEAFRVDGHVAQLEAETAQPVCDPAHIARLFTERLDALEAGFGFDAFALTALWHETMPGRQTRFDEEKQEGISFAQLIDRLSMRIGAHNVRRPIARQSHLPERSLEWRPALREMAPNELFFPDRERPLRLLDRPEPILVIYATPEGPPRRFRWRRCLHDVVKVEGPERIAPEWWRERSIVRLRDYYKIEDETGLRFWIYRNGVINDGRGGPPDWYIHGLFT